MKNGISGPKEEHQVGKEESEIGMSEKVFQNEEIRRWKTDNNVFQTLL